MFCFKMYNATKYDYDQNCKSLIQVLLLHGSLSALDVTVLPLPSLQLVFSGNTAGFGSNVGTRAVRWALGAASLAEYQAGDVVATTASIFGMFPLSLLQDSSMLGSTSLEAVRRVSTKYQRFCMLYICIYAQTCAPGRPTGADNQEAVWADWCSCINQIVPRHAVMQ
jgi:hypothetical protein